MDEKEKEIKKLKAELMQKNNLIIIKNKNNYFKKNKYL